MNTNGNSKSRKLLAAGFVLAALLATAAFSQMVQQNRTLVISGQPGQTPIVQMNGKAYVDVEALAQLANGSLSFKGSQIILTMSGSAPNATSQPANPAPTPGFSKEFLRAGIEEMTVIREWRGAILNALQNGYPVSDEFVANYRGQAATNLNLANVAVTTDADRSAFQLLSNELAKMQKLNNKVLAARKDMNYISPDALKGDPLDQQILSCARSLAAMAASGQFQDDGSCQ